jgi:hypothetical protein
MRLRQGKLSPLCPHCKLPFAPNTTVWGTRKRGRPRKYCSDVCRKAAYEARWKVRCSGSARIHRYRLCAGCGIKFDRTDRRGKRCKRFCKPQCERRTNRRERREHPGRVPQRLRRGSRSTWPSQQEWSRSRKQGDNKGFRVNAGGNLSGGTARNQAQRAAVKGLVLENGDRDRRAEYRGIHLQRLVDQETSGEALWLGRRVA